MTVEVLLEQYGKMSSAMTLLPRGIKAKDFLGMVMRGEIQATPQQIRAAENLLAIEEPKVQAVVHGKVEGKDFYTRLDKAVNASEKAKVIEATIIESTGPDKLTS